MSSQKIGSSTARVLLVCAPLLLAGCGPPTALPVPDAPTQEVSSGTRNQVTAQSQEAESVTDQTSMPAPVTPTTVTQAATQAPVRHVCVLGDSVAEQIATAQIATVDDTTSVTTGFRLFVGARYQNTDSPDVLVSELDADHTVIAIGLWDAAPFGDPNKVTEGTVDQIPEDYSQMLRDLRLRINTPVTWLLPLGTPTHANLDATLAELSSHIQSTAIAVGDSYLQVQMSPSDYVSDGVHLSPTGAAGALAEVVDQFVPSQATNTVTYGC